jgi:TPR repeat protein
VGRFYEEGRGVTQDLHQALKSYESAVQSGMPDAQVKVGQMKLMVARTQEGLTEKDLNSMQNAVGN